MSNASEAAKFSCTGCGKQYKWKPELAGKRVKCQCGQVMTAPAEPPAPPEEDEYDLAPDPVPQPPKARPAAIAPPPVAAPAASSPFLAYSGPAKPEPSEARSDLENTLGGPLWREIILPSALILAGLLFHVIREMYFSGGRQSLAEAMPHVGTYLVINLILSFAAVFLVVRLFEVSIGSPGPAALKLVAIALVPSAIASAVGSLVGHDSAFVALMASSTLFFPLCWAFFWLLFDMDAQEAMYCVVVLWLVNQFAAIMLVNLIFGAGIGL